MANLSLAQQIKEREKKLQRYSEKDVPKAARAAIYKMATKAKTSIVRTVTKELKLPAKILKKQVFTSRAKGNGIKAYIRSYLRPISAVRLISDSKLAEACGRGTNKRGVRVAGQQIDGAFINRGARNGKYYVLQRKEKSRYPLRVVNIKIDASMLKNQLPIAKRFTKDEFQKELMRQLNFRLSKYGQ